MSRPSNYKRLKQRIRTYASRYPSPSPSENTKNFKTLRELQKDGKTEQADRLRRDIIISNGAFGMRYAIKYSRLVSDKEIIDDLFQQAQIGLVEVTDKYNPYIGVNFTTYAWHYVRKCIIDYIKKNKVVIAPRDIAKNIRAVTNAMDKVYTRSNGNIATAKEIKKELKRDGVEMSEQTIDDTLILIDLNSAATSDTLVAGSINNLSSNDPNKEVNMLLKSLLLKDIDSLDEQLIDIIKMRFGIEYKRPFSLSEIKMIKGLTDKDIERYKEATKAFLNTK